MKDNMLPEEKLLKLIKAHKKTKAPVAEAIGNEPAGKHAIKSFSINFPNIAPGKVIKFLFFASLFYLIVSLLHPIFASSKIKLSSIEAKEKMSVQKEKSKLQPDIRPFGLYSTGIKQRNIFSSAALDSEKPIGTASADLIKDINLVGIVSGDEPQAIIEDKKAQKTYYLKKGQLIGQLQLADIQDGKIILDYEGQRYELYM